MRLWLRGWGCVVTAGKGKHTRPPLSLRRRSWSRRWLSWALHTRSWLPRPPRRRWGVGPLLWAWVEGLGCSAGAGLALLKRPWLLLLALQRAAETYRLPASLLAGGRTDGAAAEGTPAAGRAQLQRAGRWAGVSGAGQGSAALVRRPRRGCSQASAVGFGPRCAITLVGLPDALQCPDDPVSWLFHHLQA